MLGLAAMAVELPFLITCLLVQLLKQCPHCRHEWLSWPILAGTFPWYFATFSLRFIPRDLSAFQLKIGCGIFTACLIALIFALGRRTTLWRVPLGIGLVVSSTLAVLTFLLIAA
jgi:hypothetical protein